MKCEVKNVQSAEVFAIPPEGMIFGRAGGPANITVSDQSVSKRHARIFCKDGQWLLEDLKSVNGTVVNNRRITEPVPLAPGFVFALSKHQFEIVSVDGASGQRGAMKNGDASDPRSRRSQASSAQMQRRGAGGPSGQPMPVPDAEPLLPPEPSQRSRSVSAPQDMDSGVPPHNDPYLDELQGGGGGAGAVIAALPKSIAYYLAAVPLMALNPIGTIRKGVENPKLKAMGPLELIAFILPAMLATTLLGSWAGALGTLIAGGGFSFFGFFPIVSLAIGVAVSVVAGLIAHPVTKFVIERIFKGETDEKTRTNAVIMGETAVLLAAIPSALATLLAAVIVKLTASFGAAGFLQIIPALLMAVTAPLSPFVGWTWVKAWRCAKWAQTLMLVVTILAGLGGLYRCVNSIVDAVHAVRAGAAATVTTDDDKKGDDAKAGDDADKKDADADKKGDDDKKAASDDVKKGDDKKGDDAKKGDDDKKAAADDGKKGDDAKKGDDDKKNDDKVDDKKPDHTTAVEAAAAASGDFATYKAHRAEIDRRLDENPLLIKDRNKTTLSRFGVAYMNLLKAERNVRDDARAELAGKTRRGRPDYSKLPDAKVVERYTEAALYERTRREAENVYRVLPDK